MVLAVLVAFGAVVGAFEGVKASQHRARREEHRSRKNNLSVHCPKSSAYSALLEGRRVVLSGGRVSHSSSLSPVVSSVLTASSTSTPATASIPTRPLDTPLPATTCRIPTRAMPASCRPSPTSRPS